MKTAVIILFHGSRTDGSGEAARAIAAAVQILGNYTVVTAAFLQHAEPGFMDAVRECIDRGAERVVVVPFFLQTGTHVTADIPILVNEARQRHPDLRIEMTDAVGTHPMMANVVSDLVQTAMQADTGRK